MDRRRKGSRPKLITPYSPEYKEDKAYYECVSSDVKLVSDYTRLDFLAVEDLELFDYFGYLHDAVVWNCSRTESGKEYLETAYNHSCKEPDRDALRKNIK